MSRLYQQYRSILLSALAVVILLASCGRARPSVTPNEHIFGAPQSDNPWAFYSNLQASMGVWITDPTLGAVGDGVHDDTSALQGCISQAATIQKPCYLTIPTVAWTTTTELQPGSASSLLCWGPPGALCTIQSTSSMRSVVAVHSTVNVGGFGWIKPVYQSGLTLDANHLAQYGHLRIGDTRSHYERIHTLNALLDGFHSGGHRLGLSISAVTPGAGAPAGLTVSQPDPMFNSFGSGTSTILLTVQAGATTYVASINSAPTTATQKIIVNGPSNVMTTSLTTYVNWTGLQVVFPAGQVASGTYSFTATVPNEDTSVANAINTEGVYDDCWADTYGYSYTTGTVSTTAGSQTLPGTGTAWLTGNVGKQARPGDAITITGAGTFPIQGVADDGTIIFPPNETPGVSVAGASYGLAPGYGWYLDNSGDMARNVWRDGRIVNGSSGMRLAGQADGTAIVSGVRIDVAGNPNGIGILIGGDLGKPSNAILQGPEIKVGYGTRIYVQFGTTSLWQEPRQNINPSVTTDITGNGSATMLKDGSLFRFSPPFSGNQGSSMLLPVSSLSLTATAVSVTAANQVISPPDVLSSNPFNTTYLVLTPNADYVGLNSILLGAAHNVGQMMLLENDKSSSFMLGLVDISLAGSTERLSAPGIVLQPGEKVWVIASGAPFTPIWVQSGEVQRVFTGQSQKGSGIGTASGYVKTTTATVTTVPGLVWDATFAPTTGTVITCQISGVDTGTADYGLWSDVRFSWGPSGVVSGAMTIESARGSNAGSPPATMPGPSFVLSAGQILAQVQGAAAHTIKWWEECKQFSAVRF